MATQAGSGVARRNLFDVGARLGSRSRASFWIMLGTFAAVLSVAAAAGIQLRRDHAIALEQAERESKSFVSVSGAALALALDRTQQAVLKASAIGAGPAVASSDPSLLNVITTNLEGDVVWDRNGASAEPRRIADLQLIERLKGAPDGTGFVSGSFNDTGLGSSPITIAVRSPEIPELVHLVLINPAWLGQLVETMQGSRAGSLVVADSQSRRIAGTPVPGSLLTQSLGAMPATLSTSPALRYVSEEGASHLAAARLIPGYDLRLMSIARATDGLSDWYGSLPLYSIMIFGPSLLGAALAWALLDQMEQTSRSDKALRRTEERFELAVSGAKCGIWDWDVSGGRMYWSGAMNALLGRGRQPRNMSIGDIEAIIHPDDRGVLTSIVSSVRSGAQNYDESFRVRHEDGRYVWIRAKGQLYDSIRREGGRLSGIVLDISDLKSADARVNTAERVLEAAFENAAEAFVLWDREGRLLLCNRRFLEFYGLKEARVGDSRHRLLSHAIASDQPAPGDAAPLELFDSNGTTGTIELQYAGGRWLLVSERNVLDGARIMVATDITAIKEHEDELQASRNLLEAQTIKLGEIARNLEAEKVRAEEGSRSKSEFLAHMSHELRTPLNAIIGFSDVMRKEMLGPMPSRYLEYAADVHRSGEHLLHMIDEVLNMARIDAGGLQLDAEPLDLAGIVQDAVTVATPQADKAGVKLRLNLRPMPEIKGDRRALRDVLGNLLSNAIKFNSANGFITVETRPMDGKASVWIHDTGIGIAAANIERVIKPFERIKSAANSNTEGGTGLGLAVSNALIEIQGGKLSIESEVGIGTSVYFTLPFART